MLLIFDLDDTLIPTTKEIAPIRLRQAFDKMGVTFTDEVIAFNEKASRSEEVLRHFCDKYKLSSVIVEEGLQVLNYAPFPPKVLFQKDEEVVHLLEHLSQKHLLTLVTKGKKEIQEEKMRLFGIPSDLFQEKVIVEEGEKRPHYERLASKWGEKKKIAVIGDRIEIDLRGAKELGFHTIHMEQGRGKYVKGDKSIVDYTIRHMSELLPILEKVQGENT